MEEHRQMGISPGNHLERKDKDVNEHERLSNITLSYIYRAVQCVRAPKGSVVNFTTYQNFIELI